MTIHTTTASLVVRKTCGEESCSLSWEIKASDNNNISTYLVGTTYYARLYKVPWDLDETVFITNGSINLYSSETKTISEEILTFSGGQIQTLSNPFYEALSYSLIGDAFDIDGNKLSSVQFEVTPGTTEIKASVSCYAVLRVSYKTRYGIYRFSSPSAGTISLVALAECSEGIKTNASLNVEIKTDGSSGCLIISTEAVTPDEDDLKKDGQGNILPQILIKVYGANRGDISVYATVGSIRSAGILKTETITEYVVGIKGSFSASKPIYSLTRQTKKGGNLSSLYVEDGQLKSIMNPDDEVINGIPPGTGAYEIKYTIRYLKYFISASSYQEGVFVIKNKNYIEDSGCAEYFFQTFTLGVAEGVKKVSVTIIYKDFVTGETLDEATVWVDNKKIGVTNVNGEIFIPNISTDINHSIRAKKKGYLDTDSDSLANDTFIVRSE